MEEHPTNAAAGLGALLPPPSSSQAPVHPVASHSARQDRIKEHELAFLHIIYNTFQEQRAKALVSSEAHIEPILQGILQEVLQCLQEDLLDQMILGLLRYCEADILVPKLRLLGATDRARMELLDAYSCKVWLLLLMFVTVYKNKKLTQECLRLQEQFLGPSLASIRQTGVLNLPPTITKRQQKRLPKMTSREADQRRRRSQERQARWSTTSGVFMHPGFGMHGVVPSELAPSYLASGKPAGSLHAPADPSLAVRTRTASEREEQDSQREQCGRKRFKSEL
ncbi:uncharacterized protein BDZ99DRAFT_527149 [Mytilinidion resinicola]|uniref:Uncharacterized protein n=1 Tax=Mytilinidion resinicola TaxID=574789 RepID=A0A6A6Y242_9PEZI|nr:uncharacterized protein BDZ99DRAFT_527149 [Mytilinidion resinicola]KAF2802709.1 hypothetical protein BDZ99DRAFT_527149 [Mytilinidion resinicola]